MAVDLQGPQIVFSSHNAEGLSLLRNLNSLEMSTSRPQANMPMVQKPNHNHCVELILSYDYTQSPVLLGKAFKTFPSAVTICNPKINMPLGTKRIFRLDFPCHLHRIDEVHLPNVAGRHAEMAEQIVGTHNTGITTHLMSVVTRGLPKFLCTTNTVVSNIVLKPRTIIPPTVGCSMNDVIQRWPAEANTQHRLAPTRRDLLLRIQRNGPPLGYSTEL